MKKIMFLAIALIVMLFVLAACNDELEPLIEEEPDIVGIVKEVKPDGMMILVDSSTEVANGQVWVTITEETTFGLAVSSNFAVDNFVEITVDGAIMESDPMQALAAQVCTNDFEV